MKKIKNIGITLLLTLSVPSIADESGEEKKQVDNSVSIALTGSEIGVGGRVKWESTTESEDKETTVSSNIDLLPVGITTPGGGELSGNRFHIDLIGDSSQKRFIGSQESVVRPYVHQSFSGLEYTFDGYQNSVRMLNGGVGIGLSLNVSDNIDLSAHTGLTVGTEFGKRDGILDVSVYNEVEAGLFDVVSVVASDELRTSLSGDKEHINEVNLGFRVNDNIRAGLEYQRTQNRLADSSDYNTNYGGLFIEGRFGRSK